MWEKAHDDAPINQQKQKGKRNAQQTQTNTNNHHCCLLVTNEKQARKKASKEARMRALSSSLALLLLVVTLASAQNAAGLPQDTIATCPDSVDNENLKKDCERGDVQLVCSKDGKQYSESLQAVCGFC